MSRMRSMLQLIIERMKGYLNSTLRQFKLLNLRYTNLKTIGLAVILIQAATLFYFYQNNYEVSASLLFSSSTFTRFKENEIEIDTSSTPQAIQRYLSLQPDALRNTLYDNCVNYFATLNNTDFYDSLDVGYHPEQYHKDFYDDVLKQVQRSFEQQNKDITSVNDEADVIPLMEKYREENKKFESTLLNLMTRLRVYGKCYLDNRVNFDVSEHEKKMFPYLSGNLPVYENWEGRVVEFPTYGKRKSSSFSNSFLQQFQARLNGRGIVLSIADKLADETIQLLRVLRFLNNNLPIQLVHNNELSEQSKTKLITAARSEQIQGAKQDLWIVNVSPCLTANYVEKFAGFNSKWLAVLFSSFEEMILMDNDVVPFVKPMTFFLDYENYNKTGTFFFRDRESFERINVGSREIISKMLPTKIENYLFDVTYSTNEDLAAKFHLFEYGAKHFMESGVVVMNKVKNFKGMMTSINVQLVSALTNQLYGDKEIFWLGQVLSGNTNLYFNTHPAGNIGQIEEASKLAKTIKSIQPAHISPLDDHTLLWVNSGLKNCKKPTAEIDYENLFKPKEDSRFKSVQDVQQFYDSPLKVEGVIIPPNSNKDWNNAVHEPSRGFHQVDNEGCGGYYWHAYSRVGVASDPPELTQGLIVEFTEEEKKFIEQIEKVWIGNE